MPSAFDVSCMERAIALSEEGAARMESPFGAVIGNGAKVLAEGCNRTRSSGNPIRHAEMEALKELFSLAPPEARKNLTLYTSCEPCLMCLGAAHYSGIERIAYGTTVSEIHQFGSDDPSYSVGPVVKAAGLGIELVPGVLREHALAVLQRFFDNHGSLQ